MGFCKCLVRGPQMDRFRTFFITKCTDLALFEDIQRLVVKIQL